jgi:hypothetical protein
MDGLVRVRFIVKGKLVSFFMKGKWAAKGTGINGPTAFRVRRSHRRMLRENEMSEYGADFYSWWRSFLSLLAI